MTTFQVTTAAGLVAAFQSAADGDRIELAAGDYSAVVLKNRAFAQDITIASADPNARAVLTETLLIRAASGITIEGIDLEAASLAPTRNTSRVQLRDSADITLRDMTLTGHLPDATEGTDPDSAAATRNIPLTGYGYEFGLLVRDTDGVVIEDVEITDVRTALRLNGAADVTVSGLELHHTREGVNLSDVSNLVIENSYFHDLTPWRDPDGNTGDHPDFIQYWGTNSATGLQGLTIRDNIFYQPEGARSQSIFGHLDGAPAGVTSSDFTITGNTIINGSPNAISIYDTANVVISDNIVLPNGEDLTHTEYPRIILSDVDGAVVTGNTLVPYWNGSVLNLDAAEMAAMNVTESGNTLLSLDPAAPDYWKILHDQLLATLPGQPGPPDTGVPGDAVVLAGTTDNDVLTDRATDQGQVTHIQGLEGNDKITDTGGDDWLEGGLGADRFIFDNRKSGDAASADVVMDLDFAAGDTLRFLTSLAGSFSDALDPSNTLNVNSNGTSVTLNSLADLVELQAGASVAIAANADDSGVVLTVHDAADHEVELLGILMSDLGLA
ncbi:right-handed parallel beta-helix repeat-containing protein [Fluviibacterium sp. DFM31]|uniref:Right-handed parallel beta-helix repeat-containing protein n=1 Tax=Meridianimarinicoccus marinus TaxID=3231483 RepID=A0ABV3L9Q1_9RHOB